MAAVSFGVMLAVSACGPSTPATRPTGGEVTVGALRAAAFDARLEKDCRDVERLQLCVEFKDEWARNARGCEGDTHGAGIGEGSRVDRLHHGRP